VEASGSAGGTSFYECRHMTKRLENKVALITGAAQGIGKAAALLFAREGASVFVVDIQDEFGAETVAEIKDAGGEASYLHCDVSNEIDVSDAITNIERTSGALHILYNNASIYLANSDGKITNIKYDVWERIIGVNLRSIYLFCRLGIPLMLESGGGTVINTASSAGIMGVPNCDAYTASKGATISLTRSMAAEFGPQGIRVNCISPAGIHTPMMSESNLEEDTYDEDSYLNLRQPLRRYGTPEEIAQTALFLASSDSSFINGAIIVADGGSSINGDLSKMRFSERLVF